MAQRALSTTLVGLGCALAGTVLGWQVREARGLAPEEPEAAHPVAVHGLELLPPALEVGQGVTPGTMNRRAPSFSVTVTV